MSGTGGRAEGEGKLTACRKVNAESRLGFIMVLEKLGKGGLDRGKVPERPGPKISLEEVGRLVGIMTDEEFNQLPDLYKNELRGARDRDGRMRNRIAFRKEKSKIKVRR